jgi:hypothetical protein
MPTIDFSAKICDLDGGDIPVKLAGDAVDALTLERVVVSALLQPSDKMSGDEKYTRYTLMRKLHGAQSPVDLTVDEVSLIKRIVGESQYTPLITGQAWDILEGK